MIVMKLLAGWIGQYVYVAALIKWLLLLSLIKY